MTEKDKHRQTNSSSLPTSNNDSNTEVPPILPRLISSSIGSIVTALAVTPLEVVKVRQQARLPSRSKPKIPSNVSPCPRGCGTFILNNGLMECLLPKSAVPYFDSTGQLVVEKNGDSSLSHNNKRSAFKSSSSSSSATSSTISKSSVTSRGKPDLGTFAMIRRIFLREGFGGLYAGLAPTLIMSVPNVALYFTAYDEIVSRLHDLSSSTSGTSAATSGRTFDSIWIPLVGGSSSRMLASCTTAPLELIRTRQAARKGSGQQPTLGVFQELQTIVRNDGFASLYRGLAPTLWRDVPFSAIYWLCLETFKTEWQNNRLKHGFLIEEETHSEAFVRAIVSGASAGMVAAACTTPFDVIKTRQQMISETVQSVGHFSDHVHVSPKQGSSGGVSASVISCHHDGAVVYKPPQDVAVVSSKTKTHSSSPHKPSTLAWMQNIIETEGMTGLWRGNQARMLKVAPACAIMISCYEFGKRIME